MGIVSYCPSGHRVKVKDELAGRKGICPTCGARFRIPLASVTEPSPPGPATGVDATIPVAAVVSLDPHRAATLPRALPLVAASAAAVEREPTTAARSMPETLGTPDPMPAVAVPAVIAEAPAASWCVALPGGTPSQPMSGEDLWQWLSSGAATGAELVWRCDWSDWQPVRDVFSEHLPLGDGITGW